MSGEGSDCYLKLPEFDPFKYNDLDDLDDPIKLNKGFKLQPLPPEIFGQEKARKSKLKFKKKHEQGQSVKTSQRHVHKQGKSTFVNVKNSAITNAERQSQLHFGNRHNSIGNPYQTNYNSGDGLELGEFGATSQASVGASAFGNIV